MTKELKISAIKEGTAIDHIIPENVFKIADLLKLKNHKDVVTVATNLTSKKMGKKGIIKVGGRGLTEEEVNKIALLAPDATVSTIKDFEVVKKIRLKLPEEVYNILQCYNLGCITNKERIPTKFEVVNKSPLKIRCIYCQRIQEEIKVK
ncbi:MAG: aspartate carbamoyltransferase regulatory subunit [Nanoarchaeota archaeon]